MKLNITEERTLGMKYFREGYQSTRDRTHEEILKICKDENISLSLLSFDIRNELALSLMKKYRKSKYNSISNDIGMFWDDKWERVSILRNSNWFDIRKELIKTELKNPILFLDRDEVDYAYQFNNIEDLLIMMDETYLIKAFYITNELADFAFFYIDEGDSLILVGELPSKNLE